MSEMKVIPTPLVNEMSCTLNLARHFLMGLDYSRADTIIPTQTLGVILHAFITGHEKMQSDKIGVKEAPNPFYQPNNPYQNR